MADLTPTLVTESVPHFGSLQEPDGAACNVKLVAVCAASVIAYFAVSYPDGSDVCANIDDEPDQFRNDVEADADALESAGFSEGGDDYHDVCEYDD